MGQNSLVSGSSVNVPHSPRLAEPAYVTLAGGMSISEIAEQLGTTVRALRYYEDCGLLKPSRKNGGVRRYTFADRKEAEFIVTLRLLGLSLNEIRILQSETTEGDRLTAMTRALWRRRGCLERALARIDVMLQGTTDRDGAAR